MHSNIRRSLLVPLLCVSLFAGCDVATQMKESLEHSGPIEAEIEQAAGTRPSVASAASGPLLVVTVRFDQVPSKSVQELEALCRVAVVHEFKKEPTSLTLSFAFDKYPDFK